MISETYKWYGEFGTRWCLSVAAASEGSWNLSTGSTRLIFKKVIMVLGAKQSLAIFDAKYPDFPTSSCTKVQFCTTLVWTSCCSCTLAGYRGVELVEPKRWRLDTLERTKGLIECIPPGVRPTRYWENDANQTDRPSNHNHMVRKSINTALVEGRFIEG